MSKFIELTDYDASIHREILDALTREDNAVVEICEDRAVEEMRCYLSKRSPSQIVFSKKEPFLRKPRVTSYMCR